MNSDPRYTLTLTEKQAHALSVACELLARVGMGQLRNVADWTPTEGREGVEDYHRLQDALEAIEPLATGLGRNAFPSISRCSVTARNAYDIHQVVRYQLDGEREPGTGFCSFRREPLKVGEEPLPEIRKEGVTT